MCNGNSQLPYSQRLRTHGLTSSDLGLRPTSHTRLRTHDHYASDTLVGGKHGGGPSLLHTMFEGPMEDVNARRM